MPLIFRKAPSDFLGSVLLWREARVLLEEFVEIGGIVVAQGRGDGLDRQVCRDEQQFGLLLFAMGDVGIGCLASLALEDADEVILRHTGHLCERLDAELAVDVPADMRQYLVDAVVLDLRLRCGTFQEARHQDEEDAARLHLVAEGAALVQLDIADEGGVVVVGGGV